MSVDILLSLVVQEVNQFCYMIIDHQVCNLHHKQNCQKRKFVGIHGSWSKIMYARILK